MASSNENKVLYGYDPLDNDNISKSHIGSKFYYEDKNSDEGFEEAKLINVERTLGHERYGYTPVITTYTIQPTGKQGTKTVNTLYNRNKWGGGQSEATRSEATRKRPNRKSRNQKRRVKKSRRNRRR